MAVFNETNATQAQGLPAPTHFSQLYVTVWHLAATTLVTERHPYEVFN